jgi:cell division protein FtsW (lipid II flippase)
MIELGLIGFTLQYLLYAALCFYLYRIVRMLGEPRRLFLALGALCFILVHLTEHVAFNATASAFFWGFVGIAVAIGEEVGA